MNEDVLKETLAKLQEKQGVPEEKKALVNACSAFFTLGIIIGLGIMSLENLEWGFALFCGVIGFIFYFATSAAGMYKVLE
jgi:hypothetical protein